MGHSLVWACMGVCRLSESLKTSDSSLNLFSVTEAEFFKYFSSYAETKLLKGRVL